MMEVCMNNNNNTNKFQWSAPPTTSEQVSRPKRDFRFQVIEVCQGPKWFIWPSRNRSSHENIDENHNKEIITENTMPATYNPSNQYQTAANNGYGALRRSVLRSSKRGMDEAPRTSSEPASNRRVSLKKEKAVTEPISTPSNTFKILSIAKKWESFDATDDEDSLCCSSSTQTDFCRECRSFNCESERRRTE